MFRIENQSTRVYIQILGNFNEYFGQILKLDPRKLTENQRNFRKNVNLWFTTCTVFYIFLRCVRLQVRPKKLKLVLRKCINENYRNGLLTKTEAVCIDNCVKKYLEFNHHVTIHLRELQEPQTLMQFEMQQQELGRQMGL